MGDGSSAGRFACISPRCSTLSKCATHSLRRDASVVLLALAVALAVTVEARSDGDTLEQVRASYTSSIEALDPVRMRCRLSKAYATEAPEIGWQNVDGEVVEWAIDGGRFHCLHETANTSFRFSCDGTTTWYFNYGHVSRGEAPREARCVQRQRLETRTDSELRSFVTPGRWLGLYFNAGRRVQSGESVRTMLAKPTARHVGVEDVAGHECVATELVFQLLDGTELPVRVAFDPEFGFLPRRIVFDLKPVVPVVHEYLVREFRRISRDDGEAVFVPAVMEMRSLHPESPREDTSGRLVLEEVQVGGRPDRHLFHPEIPEGIPVFNLDNRSEHLAWQDFLAGKHRKRSVPELRRPDRRQSPRPPRCRLV